MQAEDAHCLDLDQYRSWKASQLRKFKLTGANHINYDLSFRSLLLALLVGLPISPEAQKYSGLSVSGESKEIAALFDRWNAALAPGEPEEAMPRPNH
jgi:hypothetical protein